MKTLTETNAEVTYDQVLRAVVVNWKGFADSDQCKKILEHSLAMIKERKSSIWISDMVHGKAIPRDIVEWLQKNFVPTAKQYGINKMAFLVTGNAFGKLYAANLKAATKQLNVDMKSFDSKQELENWLYT